MMHITDFLRSSVAVCGAVMVAVAVALVGGVAAQAPADVAGVWIDHTGQGAVEVSPCGAGNSRLCGRVIWLKNPDHKSKSGKPICGTQILGDLRREGAHAWGEGWIYNPEDEERFSAAVELAGANTLKVTGYLGFRLLGETFTWTRATSDLDRCAKSQSAGAG